MKIKDLIDTLTKLSNENPGLTDCDLEFFDRDNNICKVENVQLLKISNVFCLTDMYCLVDLGGQYVS